MTMDRAIAAAGFTDYFKEISTQYYQCVKCQVPHFDKEFHIYPDHLRYQSKHGIQDARTDEPEIEKPATPVFDTRIEAEKKLENDRRHFVRQYQLRQGYHPRRSPRGTAATWLGILTLLGAFIVFFWNCSK